MHKPYEETVSKVAVQFMLSSGKRHHRAWEVEALARSSRRSTLRA